MWFNNKLINLSSFVLFYFRLSFSHVKAAATGSQPSSFEQIVRAFAELDPTIPVELQDQAPTTPNEDRIDTEQGPVIGAVHAHHREFRGIPFATAARWEGPYPAPLRAGDLDATRNGPQCFQLKKTERLSDIIVSELFKLNGATESEDCLNLNIFAPKTHYLPQTGRALWPVTVFVYGGYFMMGANSMSLYNASKLVAMQRNTVVVVLNYRLHAFGFSPLPSDDTGTSGNLGMLDVLEGLMWVQKNIRAFGGDPDTVTLMGHSAGAVLAHTLNTFLATNEFRTMRALYHRLILLSGSVFTLPLRSLAQAHADTRALAHACKCPAGSDDALVQCLKGVSAADLTRAIERNRKWANIFGPVYGGSKILPVHPAASFNAGHFLNVPTLATSTADDGSLIVAQFGSINHGKIFSTMISSDIATRVAPFYPPPAPDADPTNPLMVPNEFLLANHLLTDALFLGPARHIATTIARAGTSAFSYVFETPIALPQHPVQLSEQARKALDAFQMSLRFLGAFHGAELVHLFAILPPVLLNPNLAVIRATQERVMGFVKSGVPMDRDGSLWAGHGLDLDARLHAKLVHQKFKPVFVEGMTDEAWKQSQNAAKEAKAQAREARKDAKLRLKELKRFEVGWTFSKVFPLNAIATELVRDPAAAINSIVVTAPVVPATPAVPPGSELDREVSKAMGREEPEEMSPYNTLSCDTDGDEKEVCSSPAPEKAQQTKESSMTIDELLSFMEAANARDIHPRTFTRPSTMSTTATPNKLERKHQKKRARKETTSNGTSSRDDENAKTDGYENLQRAWEQLQAQKKDRTTFRNASRRNGPEQPTERSLKVGDHTQERVGTAYSANGWPSPGDNHYYGENAAN